MPILSNFPGAKKAAVQDKTVTPTAQQQVVLPDSGYDYLSSVTVTAIPYTEQSNTYGTTVLIASSNSSSGVVVPASMLSEDESTTDGEVE